MDRTVEPATGPIPATPPGPGRRAPSPARQFAILSLVTIGASTLLFGFALAYFVERGILDREWASTAALLRAVAGSALRPSDLALDRVPAEVADRFEELSRQARMLPEIHRLVAYDGRGRVLWADVEHAPPAHGVNPPLAQALATGQTRVRLDPGAPRGQERVELYVPITFPGEGRVAGVVEAYVDQRRVFASVRRARLTLWSLAALSGALLYGVLYGIVWRASRRLRTQHVALVRRAEDLAHANAELRRVQQELVAAERFAAFGEITAAVAHGLANPLASIRATTQVALLDVPEEPVREQLQRVIAETDRLTQRMRALLDFGRPVDQRRVPTALDAAVRHALGPLGARAASQGVVLHVDVPAELPKVRVDPACFEEAFLCLASNALDAMPAGGTLRITGQLADHAVTLPPVAATDLSRRAVQLTVADTGPGMPVAVLRRALEPFFTTKPNGTGLGLAVARKLLDASGGRLELTSDTAGTRALITLPAADDA